MPRPLPDSVQFDPLHSSVSSDSFSTPTVKGGTTVLVEWLTYVFYFAYIAQGVLLARLLPR